MKYPIESVQEYISRCERHNLSFNKAYKITSPKGKVFLARLIPYNELRWQMPSPVPLCTVFACISKTPLYLHIVPGFTKETWRIKEADVSIRYLQSIIETSSNISIYWIKSAKAFIKRYNNR